MPMPVHAAILESLTPIVGRPIAQICVRSCAIAVGKPAETMAPSDMPQIARTIRESLGPLAPQQILEGAIDQIRASVA